MKYTSVFLICLVAVAMVSLDLFRLIFLDDSRNDPINNEIR